jgi:hypothetical protein
MAVALREEQSKLSLMMGMVITTNSLSCFFFLFLSEFFFFTNSCLEIREAEHEKTLEHPNIVIHSMFGRSGVRRSSWDQSQISTKSSSKFTKLRGFHSKTEAAIIGNILLPPFLKYYRHLFFSYV